ncbi:MAG: DUF4294 domain-containing protein [Bacteroidota bacterium]
MRKILFYSFLLLIFTTSIVKAQDTTAVVTRAAIVNGDTLPIVPLSEVKIYGKLIFGNKIDALQFSRTVLIVKSVYPYAKIVAVKAKEFNTMIANANSRKEKKRLMKKAEDELMSQFEDDVKKMNDEQGSILIKLIDRETGSSSYDLIKDFRGGLVATFYQSFGRVYGYNLKSKYDPTGEDKNIEQIVVMLENGQL